MREWMREWMREERRKQIEAEWGERPPDPDKLSLAQGAIRLRESLHQEHRKRGRARAMLDEVELGLKAQRGSRRE